MRRALAQPGWCLLPLLVLLAGCRSTSPSGAGAAPGAEAAAARPPSVGDLLANAGTEQTLTELSLRVGALSSSCVVEVGA